MAPPTPPTPPALIQARQHFQAGRVNEAQQLLQRYLQRDPRHAEANHSMAVILLQKGLNEQALYHVQKAVAASPTEVEYLITRASLLGSLGRREEAVQAARGALEHCSRDAGALLKVTLLSSELGDHEGALRAAELAYSIDPRQSRGMYASVLSNIGEADRAVLMLRDELAREPDAVDVLHSLALAMNYAGAEAGDMFDVHRRFGIALEDRVGRLAPPAEAMDPDKRLRIGLVSPDFYSHSVAFFAEPIIRHLDREQFEVFCYSSRLFPDDTTRRLKGLADGWRDTGGLPDSRVIEIIRADRIDILIDLVGLTTGSALSIFAAKPAPVQVTAIGYPNTTGLTSIDYRLVDAITDPPGSDAFATERLLRLPGCFLCYTPMGNAPAVNSEPPAARTGAVTFGSFNTAQKLVGPVIGAWARIVNGVPGAKIVLKASQFSCPMVRARFTEKFRAAGLDPARLELLPVVKDKAGHLALYDRLDIALDAFAYNGTTTTCEALFMGVPVVTLRGSVHAGRVGASLLTAVGTPELIAGDVDEYIAIATRLAGERDRLRTLRSTLRDRMLRSPLCDGPGYGTRLGAALRDIWHSHAARR